MKRLCKKENIKYILLFLLFTTFQLFYNNLICDYLWSYGFSFNIATKLVPYKDFNMIIPPFTAYLFSLPLLIYNKIHIYAISYSILLTTISYFLFKLYKEKTWIILLLIFLPYPIFLFTCNYNIMCYLFLLLLIYLEKKNKNDYLIGLILALSFFTKQSIGLLFIIVGLITEKNHDKRKKRIFAILIITSLFLIYFLIANNLREFIDFCFLGMFSFKEKNGDFTIYTILITLIIISLILKIKKQRKEKENYYLLAFTTMAYPLFDIYHFLLVLISYMPILLKDRKQDKLNQYIFWIPIFLITFTTLHTDSLLPHTYPNNIPYFEYYYFPNYVTENLSKIKKYSEENKEKKIVFITSNSYIYKMISNRKVEKYIDILSYGNMGLRGSANVINELKNNKGDTLYLVDDKIMKINSKKVKTQLDTITLNYFYQNAKKIGKIENFTIYTIEN